MTDETTPADPQAGDAEQINTQPQAGDTSTNPQAGEPKPQRSAEDYERIIADLRKEAANYRTKNKKYEEEEAKRLESQMTEQQKKDKQYADLQKEHADYILRTQERIIAGELRVQAARLGFADPADAIAMLDRTKLELDDDGNPTNAEDLLKALLKAKPYLAGKPAQAAPTAGGATSPSRSVTASVPEQITREYIASLTPETFAKLPREVQQRIGEINYQQPWKRR